MKLLYISQEVFPYLPQTNISKSSRDVAVFFHEQGHQIRVFTPCFGIMNQRKNQLHEVIRLSGINIVIDETDYPLIIKVSSLPKVRLQVYFIDNEDYFQRKAIFSKQDEFFSDNIERALFFTQGVLETVQRLHWKPDIVHCHGWFTHLLPVYLKKNAGAGSFFGDSKIVTSLYNEDVDLSVNNLSNLLEEDLEDEEREVLTNCTLEGLAQSAVKFSDGILLTPDLPQSIVDYVKSSGKPYINYNFQDEDMEAIKIFYNQI